MYRKQSKRKLTETIFGERNGEGVCTVKENFHFLLNLCTVGVFYNDSLLVCYLCNQTHIYRHTDTVQSYKCYYMVEVSTKLTGLSCWEG